MKLLYLEAKVLSSSQSENDVNGLQLTVGEVSGQLEEEEEEEDYVKQPWIEKLNTVNEKRVEQRK